MTPTSLRQDDADYPRSLMQYLNGDDPNSIGAIGDIGIVHKNGVGLICSIKCPGSIILKTYDAIRELRDAGTTIIGGFHSPMEKECLAILLRGEQPIIVCPARSLEGMQIPKEWRQRIEAGRLLLLSPFGKGRRRATADLAVARNSFVAALASTILIAHASVGGKVMGLAERLVQQGRQVLTISDPENEPLITLGAKPLASVSSPEA